MESTNEWERAEEKMSWKKRTGKKRLKCPPNLSEFSGNLILS